MPEGAVGGLLCALVIGVAVETLIGAVLLRAAVALYNKMAGGALSPASVPAPAFGKAMGITFATSLVQMIVGVLIGLITGTWAEAAGTGGKRIDPVAQLISFPVGLLIMAAMLSGMLPTTFGRAALVTLCYLLIVIFVVGILFAIYFAAFGVVLKGV